VPADEPIPKSKLALASKSKNLLGEEARLAITLSKLQKGKTAKRT
jgi:hypothetical protein